MPDHKHSAVRNRIEVVEPERFMTIESKITVREIAKHTIKAIEQSKAWKEHQKQHKDARLTMTGLQEPKGASAVEKAIFEFEKQDEKQHKRASKPGEDEWEQTRAPGQEVQQKAVTYKGAGQQEAGGPTYHGRHEATNMASCNCGQVFKTDAEGNTQAYKIKTDEVSQEGFSAYRKQPEQEQPGFGYKKKALHEEIEETRKYGR